MTIDRGPSPLRLETKFVALDASALRDDARIEGYASLFDTPDDSLDEVAPGAFVGSLVARRSGVKLLWQHDPAAPIGVWESVSEDERGLRVRGRLLTEVRQGAEAAALLRAGAVDGLSIGYRTVRASRLPSGGRRLTEIDLWEVSLVTFPMLPEARAVAGVAEEDGVEDVRALSAAFEAARGALR